jgi:DNA-directed RNA polymerase specialized sigma24 family protein
MADNPSRGKKPGAEYGSLIGRALGNERKNFFRDTERLAKKQTSFGELDRDRIESVRDEGALEAFELIESEFRVMEHSVAVRDAMLYEALSRLDEAKREIILMAFWLDMSDREIADETDTPLRTVNGIRNRSYKELREILEEKGYDANRFFPKGGGE